MEQERLEKEKASKIRERKNIPERSVAVGGAPPAGREVLGTKKYQKKKKMRQVKKEEKDVT